MSHPATLTRRALNDLRAAIQWIVADNLPATTRLRNAVDKAARTIGEYPQIGRNRIELTSPRYRVWPLPGFPYLLVYDPETQPPRIARILHMARDLPDALHALQD